MTTAENLPDIDHGLSSLTEEVTAAEFLRSKGQNKKVRTINKEKLKQWIAQALMQSRSSTVGAYNDAEKEEMLKKTQAQLDDVMARASQAEKEVRKRDQQRLAMSQEISVLQEQAASGSANDSERLEQAMATIAKLQGEYEQAHQESGDLRLDIYELQDELNAKMALSRTTMEEKDRLKSTMQGLMVRAGDLSGGVLQLDHLYYASRHSLDNEPDEDAAMEEQFFHDFEVGAKVIESLMEDLEALRKITESESEADEANAGLLSHDLELLEQLKSGSLTAVDVAAPVEGLIEALEGAREEANTLELEAATAMGVPQAATQVSRLPEADGDAAEVIAGATTVARELAALFAKERNRLAALQAMADNADEERNSEEASTASLETFYNALLLKLTHAATAAGLESEALATDGEAGDTHAQAVRIIEELGEAPSASALETQEKYEALIASISAEAESAGIELIDALRDDDDEGALNNTHANAVRLVEELGESPSASALETQEKYEALIARISAEAESIGLELIAELREEEETQDVALRTVEALRAATQDKEEQYQDLLQQIRTKAERAGVQIANENQETEDAEDIEEGSYLEAQHLLEGLSDSVVETASQNEDAQKIVSSYNALLESIVKDAQDAGIEVAPELSDEDIDPVRRQAAAEQVLDALAEKNNEDVQHSYDSLLKQIAQEAEDAGIEASPDLIDEELESVRRQEAAAETLQLLSEQSATTQSSATQNIEAIKEQLDEALQDVAIIAPETEFENEYSEDNATLDATMAETVFSNRIGLLVGKIKDLEGAQDESVAQVLRITDENIQLKARIEEHEQAQTVGVIETQLAQAVMEAVAGDEELAGDDAVLDLALATDEHNETLSDGDNRDALLSHCEKVIQALSTRKQALMNDVETLKASQVDYDNNLETVKQQVQEAVEGRDEVAETGREVIAQLTEQRETKTKELETVRIQGQQHQEQVDALEAGVHAFADRLQDIAVDTEIQSPEVGTARSKVREALAAMPGEETISVSAEMAESVYVAGIELMEALSADGGAQAVLLQQQIDDMTEQANVRAEELSTQVSAVDVLRQEADDQAESGRVALAELSAQYDEKTQELAAEKEQTDALAAGVHTFAQHLEEMACETETESPELGSARSQARAALTAMPAEESMPLSAEIAESVYIAGIELMEALSADGGAQAVVLQQQIVAISDKADASADASAEERATQAQTIKTLHEEKDASVAEQENIEQQRVELARRLEDADTSNRHLAKEIAQVAAIFGEHAVIEDMHADLEVSLSVISEEPSEDVDESVHKDIIAASQAVLAAVKEEVLEKETAREQSRADYEKLQQQLREAQAASEDYQAQNAELLESHTHEVTILRTDHVELVEKKTSERKGMQNQIDDYRLEDTVLKKKIAEQLRLIGIRDEEITLLKQSADDVVDQDVELARLHEQTTALEEELECAQLRVKEFEDEKSARGGRDEFSVASLKQKVTDLRAERDALQGQVSSTEDALTTEKSRAESLAEDRQALRAEFEREQESLQEELAREKLAHSTGAEDAKKLRSDLAGKEARIRRLYEL